MAGKFDEVEVTTPMWRIGGKTGTDLVAEGKTLVKTQTSYQTAVSVQKPRNLDRIVQAVVTEAKQAGTAFFYSWPVKSKRPDGSYETKIVNGGSIGLAMCIAREWGNDAVEVDLITEPDAFLFKAAAIDLESGFTITRIFRQSREGEPPGKYDKERWQDMTFQKGQSKAIRNVLLALTPAWIKNAAIKAAKDGGINAVKAEGLDKSRSSVVTSFADRGIGLERITAVLGKAVGLWDAEDVVRLRSMWQELEDGSATADELFPPLEAAAPKQPAQAAQEAREQGKAAFTERPKPKDETPAPQADSTPAETPEPENPPVDDVGPLRNELKKLHKDKPALYIKAVRKFFETFGKMTPKRASMAIIPPALEEEWSDKSLVALHEIAKDLLENEG